MSWNHRVLLLEGEEPFYEVREVYYGEDGIPHSWSSVPSRVAGDTIHEARLSHLMIAQAFLKPILKVVGNKLEEVHTEEFEVEAKDNTITNDSVVVGTNSSI